MKTFLDEMIEESKREGELRGELRGKREGKLEGKRSDIIDWLVEDYGPEANALIENVNSISDFNVLKKILRLMPLGSLEAIERGVDEILKNAR